MTVHCPNCGDAVEFEVGVRAVHWDHGNLTIQFYDWKPKHKCKRGGGAA